MSVLSAIGNTPLVEVTGLSPNPKVRLMAKLEGNNPGGSVKDRPALWMIEAAERSGELTPDKTLLEPTSGNTGIGVAMVAAAKGYKCKLTMPACVSLERRNVLAHYESTGPEIWEETNGEVTVFVAGLGTTGTIMGVGQYLKEQNPDCQIVAVEPVEGHARLPAARPWGSLLEHSAIPLALRQVPAVNVGSGTARRQWV